MRETAFMLVLIGVGSLTGCEPVAQPSGRAQSNPGASTFSAAPDVRRLLTPGNGLEMRDWVIMDRESRIGAAIAEFGQPAFVDPKANTPFYAPSAANPLMRSIIDRTSPK